MIDSARLPIKDIVEKIIKNMGTNILGELLDEYSFPLRSSASSFLNEPSM